MVKKFGNTIRQDGASYVVTIPAWAIQAGWFRPGEYVTLQKVEEDDEQ